MVSPAMQLENTPDAAGQATLPYVNGRLALMGGKPGKFHDARPEVDGERRFAQHRITQDARDLDTLELTDGPQIHGERSVFDEGQPAHAESQGSGAKCAGERPHLASSTAAATCWCATFF